MKKNINYESILELFTTEKEGIYKWREAPFKIGNKVYATDAHAIVIMNADLAPEIKDLTDYDPANVLRTIPPFGPSLGEIRIDDLKEALSKVPMVDVQIWCKACGGEGDVDFEFVWERITYWRNYDCPVCNGSHEIQKVPHELEYDPTSHIVVGKSIFRARILDMIVQAGELSGSEEIKVLYQQDPVSATIFGFEGFDVMAMPVAGVDVEDTLFNIQFREGK